MLLKIPMFSIGGSSVLVGLWKVVCSFARVVQDAKRVGELKSPFARAFRTTRNGIRVVGSALTTAHASIMLH